MWDEADRYQLVFSLSITVLFDFLEQDVNTIINPHKKNNKPACQLVLEILAGW
jgi:hypothetical protein